jgi:hypothetical protein
MDNSKEGVILVSFGTVALSHQIPARIKQVFLESFKEFPSYTFLWKYEQPEDNISANCSNVIDVPWIPQRDIFCKSEKLILNLPDFSTSKTTWLHYAWRPKFRNGGGLRRSSRDYNWAVRRSAKKRKNGGISWIWH